MYYISIFTRYTMYLASGPAVTTPAGPAASAGPVDVRDGRVSVAEPRGGPRAWQSRQCHVQCLAVLTIFIPCLAIVWPFLTYF